jgi:hypothetical protein
MPAVPLGVIQIYMVRSFTGLNRLTSRPHSCRESRGHARGQNNVNWDYQLNLFVIKLEQRLPFAALFALNAGQLAASGDVPVLIFVRFREKYIAHDALAFQRRRAALAAHGLDGMRSRQLACGRTWGPSGAFIRLSVLPCRMILLLPCHFVHQESFRKWVN